MNHTSRRSLGRRWARFTSTLVASAIAIAGWAGLVSAQEADSLRQEYLLTAPEEVFVSMARAWTSPGISLGSPTGFGARQGHVFAAAGYQARTRRIPGRRIDRLRRQDGAVVAGFGVGNPSTLAGLEVAVTSYSTVRSGLGTNMGVSAKMHRIVAPRTGIAVGVENVVTRGNPNVGISAYAVASRVIHLREDPADLFGALALSGGLGNGRFRRESDIIDDVERVNPFGSAALQVSRLSSLVADWSGQDLAVGASIAPLRRVPFVVTAGLADVTGRFGTPPRFVAGAGFGYQVLPPH